MFFVDFQGILDCGKDLAKSGPLGFFKVSIIEFDYLVDRVSNLNSSQYVK